MSWARRLLRAPADPEVARRRRVVAWTATAALVVRVFYFREHGESAFSQVPILDESFYDAVARALVAGDDVAAIDPAFRPLLYPAFLAVFYLLAGPAWGLDLALVAQHLLGTGTAALVAGLAIRLHDDWRAGAATGVLWVLAGPPLFFEGELLITTLFTFLVTLLLVALTRCRFDGPSGASGPIPWILAGSLVGLAALARANVLPALAALPILAAWPAAGPPAVSRRRRASLALVGLVAAGVVLGAGAYWQSRATGHLQFLPSAGGVNLYLGNKRGADGRIPRQDRHATYGLEYRDSVQLFALEVYREETGDEAFAPDPDAISRFWTKRALEEIAADPAAWVTLMARKVGYLLWDREIPNNKGYLFVAEHESAILGALPVSWGVLLALAGLGLGAAWRGGDRHALVGLLGVCLPYAAGVVLFFVNGRFRLPLWPATAALAGGGAILLVDLLLRREELRRRLPELSTAVVLAVLAFAPRPEVGPPNFFRDFYFRSLAHFEKGNLDAAREDAERAAELEPTDPAAFFQLGTVALAQDDLAVAQEAIVRASRLEPEEPRIWNNLGIVLEKRGRIPEAYTAYIAATQKGSGYAPAWVNAALLDLRAGETERAGRKIVRAEQLGDRSVHLQCARAFFEIQRGRLAIGKAILDGANQRDAELVERLVQEHARPLELRFGTIE